MARAEIPASTPYIVCCWFSPLLKEVFLRGLWYSPLLKNQHFSKSNLIQNEWTHFNEFLRTPKYLVGKQITFRITITYVAVEVLYHNIRSKISLTSNHIGSFEPTHGSIAIGTENNSYFLASSYTQNWQPPSEPAHSPPAPTHSPPLPATPGICVR